MRDLTDTGSHHWQTLRQLRPSVHPSVRLLYARLWPHDDFYLHRILSIRPRTGYLQPHRCQCSLLPRHDLSHYVVFPQTSSSSWYYRHWFQSWRGHLPYHGRETSSRGGIWMGDEDLCFSNPCNASNCQPDCEGAHPPLTKTSDHDGIHSSTHGVPLPPSLHCVIHLLSRGLPPAQFYHIASPSRWHVGASGRLPAGHPECYEVLRPSPAAEIYFC